MRRLGKGHGALGHGPLFGKSSISLSILPKTLNRTSAALSSSSNIKDLMAASSRQSKLMSARFGLSIGGNALKPEASIQSNPAASTGQHSAAPANRPFFRPSSIHQSFCQSS